jgi:hypothetical protein
VNRFNKATIKRLTLELFKPQTAVARVAPGGDAKALD